jgi:hypothetical protein
MHAKEHVGFHIVISDLNENLNVGKNVSKTPHY